MGGLRVHQAEVSQFRGIVLFASGNWSRKLLELNSIAPPKAKPHGDNANGTRLPLDVRSLDDMSLCALRIHNVPFCDV